MKTLPLVLLAVVTVGALADLQVGLRAGPESVSDAAMKEAAVAIRAQRKPGDVLVHSPLFGGLELRLLAELRTRPDLPTADTRANRRILLLDRRDFPMGGFEAPATVHPLPEPLVLKVFEPAGGSDLVRFELTQDFSASTVSVERPPGTEVSRCSQPRAEGGFSCPGQAEWLRASFEVLRVGAENRDCMWAHPTAGGALVFELPAQEAPPPGRELFVQVGAGITDDAVTGTPGGAEVRTRIEQDGSLGQLRAPNIIGWYEVEYAIAAQKPVHLNVVATRDGRRHHCLAARIIERPVSK